MPHFHFARPSEAYFAQRALRRHADLAVFGAVLSYILQLLSFLQLRRSFPSLERSYHSPFGKTGAVVSRSIALAALLALFLNRDYRSGMLEAVLWFLLGTGYFAWYGRKRLVLAPEEHFTE